jgi:hypothetical protein
MLTVLKLRFDDLLLSRMQCLPIQRAATTACLPKRTIFNMASVPRIGAFVNPVAKAYGSLSDGGVKIAVLPLLLFYCL